MEQTIIDKILRCRGIIEKHRKRDTIGETDEKHIVSMDDMNAGLALEGFDSLLDYSKWDEQQCFDHYCECRPIKGDCDKCVGYEGTPPCQLMYGAGSCVFISHERSVIIKASFKYFCKKISKTQGTRIAVCPAGHGYYINAEDIKEPVFDITWGVYK